MKTLSVPEAAVYPLSLAAATATPKSHRGRLVARLDSAEVKRFGRGCAHVVEVPDGLVKELAVWVDDAKSFANSKSESEGLRRVRQRVQELVSS